MLDLTIFTPAQSENFKWWDGYVNKKFIHIEEMGEKNKMPFDRLKTLCDVQPLRVEMKGSVSRRVRPLITVFTSNYSPGALYLEEWDEALISRFSSERFLGPVKDNHTWSGDMIWNIPQTKAGREMLYSKLRALFPQIDMPEQLPKDVLAIYEDPPFWPDPHSVTFLNPQSD